MLSLLLDEQLSPKIVSEIKKKRDDISITSVHIWQAGRYMHQPDELILAAAAGEGMTLVTYDQKTIVPVLVQWGHAGTDHSGVIFIDNFTITSRDFGTIIRSLIAVWDSSHGADWTNTVIFLRPVV